MISAQDRVKLKTSDIFVEAEPPKGRTRPLEWRRSISTIDVDATRFVIKEHHTVSELDYITNGLFRADLKAADDTSDPDEEKEQLKPKPGLRTILSSKIPLEDIHDSLYRTVEEDKDEKIYSFSRAKGYLELSISDDEPLKEPWAIFAAGTHFGHAWIEENDEKLTIYVSVEKDVLKHLVSEIKSGRVAEVNFRIAIDSFSDEVDDFLREWYHPRDLVIDGRMVHAALESFSVVSKEYAQQPLMLATRIPDDDTDNSDDIEPQVQFYQPQINNIIDPAYLKSIKTALWVIAGALVFIWLSSNK
jgi:hypothetical protein